MKTKTFKTAIIIAVIVMLVVASLLLVYANKIHLLRLPNGSPAARPLQ